MGHSGNRGHMIELKWHAHEVMVEVNSIMKAVNKKVANNVMKDAIRILKHKATTHSERGLLKQFDVRPSKFKDGGYLVYCQGPGNWWPPYHASFVELGTRKTRYMEAKPFMRPAYKKNIRKANRMFRDALGKL